MFLKRAFSISNTNKRDKEREKERTSNHERQSDAGPPQKQVGFSLVSITPLERALKLLQDVIVRRKQAIAFPDAGLRHVRQLQRDPFQCCCSSCSRHRQSKRARQSGHSPARASESTCARTERESPVP